MTGTMKRIPNNIENIVSNILLPEKTHITLIDNVNNNKLFSILLCSFILGLFKSSFRISINSVL